MNTRQLMRLVMAGLAALALTSAASAELLYNPGFEDLDANGSYGDGWGNWGATGFHAFFGPANGHASLFADAPGNFGGIYQLGIVGAAGVNYTFSLADMRIESNANNDLRFGVEFYLADDSTKIGEALQSVPMTPGDGLAFTMNAVSPAGTGRVRPIIRFDNVFLPGTTGQANMFVFSASLVPEPSTGLVLLAGLALGALRRR